MIPQRVRFQIFFIALFISCAIFLSGWLAFCVIYGGQHGNS